MAPTATPTGYVLYERHIEKNAGSTFRELLYRNERHGLCLYWGYQQRSPFWNRFVEAMGNLTSSSTLPRVCIEAHSHIDHGTPSLRRMEQLLELRRSLKRRRIHLRILLLLRLREPLAHYVSYYLWSVAERQARSPERYGRTFEEWASSVPNLQSELLLSSKAAFTASFAGLPHREIAEWRGRWENPRESSARRKQLLRVASWFDVLGTAERFDETSLLVGRNLGWRPADAAPSQFAPEAAPVPSDSCLNKRLTDTLKTWWCRDFRKPAAAERARVHAHVCPDKDACARLIRRIAPVDYELYNLANKRLDAAIRGASAEFQAELEQLREAKRGPPDRGRCGWLPIRGAGGRPATVAGWHGTAKGREVVASLTPNFTSSEACVRGEQSVMGGIWTEHRMGGRAKSGSVYRKLVPYPPQWLAKLAKVHNSSRGRGTRAMSAHGAAQRVTRAAAAAHSSGRDGRSRSRVDAPSKRLSSGPFPRTVAPGVRIVASDAARAAAPV